MTEEFKRGPGRPPKEAPVVVEAAPAPKGDKDEAMTIVLHRKYVPYHLHDDGKWAVNEPLEDGGSPEAFPAGTTLVLKKPEAIRAIRHQIGIPAEMDFS